MRINKVTLRVIALSAVLVLLALPLSNLVVKSSDPFKPSKVKIDSSSISGYYNQNFNWNDCYGGFLCATFKVPIDYDNLELGEFDIAPDFTNGGIYKDIDLETKKFEVITDDLPF